MGLQIESGDGNGFSAGVDSLNRLKTSAITNPRSHSVNHTSKKAYTFTVSVTPTGAGDCFMYIKNNDDEDMNIDEIAVYCASDEIFQFKFHDIGTPGGVTVINTPTNRNAGSGNLADVTALTGVDITGLSGGDVVAGFFKDGGTDTKIIKPRSGFIISKNQILTGYVVTGTAAVLVGMGIYFHSSQG